MNDSTDKRQEKFRAKMKESGKRQRTFFLSDEAMDSLKQSKEEFKAPSINHALEFMLTKLLPPELCCKQQAVVEQAQIVAQHYAAFSGKPEDSRQSEEKLLLDALATLSQLLGKTPK